MQLCLWNAKGAEAGPRRRVTAVWQTLHTSLASKESQSPATDPPLRLPAYSSIFLMSYKREKESVCVCVCVGRVENKKGGVNTNTGIFFNKGHCDFCFAELSVFWYFFKDSFFGELRQCSTEILIEALKFSCSFILITPCQPVQEVVLVAVTNVQRSQWDGFHLRHTKSYTDPSQYK